MYLERSSHNAVISIGYPRCQITWLIFLLIHFIILLLFLPVIRHYNYQSFSKIERLTKKRDEMVNKLKKKWEIFFVAFVVFLLNGFYTYRSANSVILRTFCCSHDLILLAVLLMYFWYIIDAISGCVVCFGRGLLNFFIRHIRCFAQFLTKSSSQWGSPGEIYSAN